MPVKLSLQGGATTRTVTATNEQKAGEILNTYAESIGVPTTATLTEKIDAILSALIGYMTERSKKYTVEKANQQGLDDSENVDFGGGTVS